jgi:hypothetical protein
MRIGKKGLAVRDAIMAKYLPKIPAAVGRFLRRNRDYYPLEEDMQSQASERVFYAATRHVTGFPIENIPAYMHQCIMTGIYLVIRNDKAIQKPRDCQARRVRVDKSYSRGWVYRTLDNCRDETPLLDACCADDIDVDILKFTYRGMGHNAISKELGITVKNIKDRKVEILRRLELIRQDDDVAGSEDGA